MYENNISVIKIVQFHIKLNTATRSLMHIIFSILKGIVRKNIFLRHESEDINKAISRISVD